MEVEVMCPPPELMNKVRDDLQRLFAANAEVLAARCTEACVQQVWAACLARLASQAELMSPSPGPSSSSLQASPAAPTLPTPPMPLAQPETGSLSPAVATASGAPSPDPEQSRGENHQELSSSASSASSPTPGAAAVAVGVESPSLASSAPSTAVETAVTTVAAELAVEAVTASAAQVVENVVVAEVATVEPVAAEAMPVAVSAFVAEVVPVVEAHVESATGVAPIPLPTHGATDSTREVVASAPTDDGSVEPPQHKQERQRTVKFAEPLCSAHSPMPDESTPKFETPANDAEVAHARATVTFAEPLCAADSPMPDVSTPRFETLANDTEVAHASASQEETSPKSRAVSCASEAVSEYWEGGTASGRSTFFRDAGLDLPTDTVHGQEEMHTSEVQSSAPSESAKSRAVSCASEAASEYWQGDTISGRSTFYRDAGLDVPVDFVKEEEPGVPSGIDDSTPELAAKLLAVAEQRQDSSTASAAFSEDVPTSAEADVSSLADDSPQGKEEVFHSPQLSHASATSSVTSISMGAGADPGPSSAPARSSVCSSGLEADLNDGRELSVDEEAEALRQTIQLMAEQLETLRPTAEVDQEAELILPGVRVKDSSAGEASNGGGLFSLISNPVSFLRQSTAHMTSSVDVTDEEPSASTEEASALTTCNGAEELAREQLEFQAWFDKVAVAATELLDERDRQRGTTSTETNSVPKPADEDLPMF